MPSIPVQHTWAVGEEVTSANLNLIPAGINWAYNGKPILGVHCPNGNTTSIANATWTAVTLNTVDVDSHSGWAYGNSINDHYTAQISGWYMILGCIVFSSSSTAGSRAVRLMINGSTVAGIASHGTSLINTGVCIARMVYLAELDYIELQGYQNSGAALSTAANYTNGAEAPFFNVIFFST